MNTYIAKIETADGTQNIKLAAVSQEQASQMVEQRAQASTTGSFRYTLAEQSPLQSPETFSHLMNASISLFSCVVFLIVADYKIKKWLKN
jgi:hypothetical protein